MRTKTKIILALIFPLALVGVSFFLFILPPNVTQSVPLNGSSGVDLSAPLEINFDKPVKRTWMEHSIEPNVPGEWEFQNSLMKNHLYRTLVFVPAFPLQPDTQYTVSLKNITNSPGVGMSGDFSYTFKTKNELPKEIALAEDAAPNQLALASSVVLPEPAMKILDIPMHWQERALSCEAASLKMALNFKGTAISENTIMKKIGFDLTPRKDNVWGDPNKSFVGNIDGSSCKTGYGVYWDAVAEVAKNWSDAESFSNWTLQDITREIRAGNPVVVWGTIPVKQLTDCSWYTTEGKYIKAFRETHVRTVVGYVGPAANPTKIIMNDPLSGTLYWTAEKFMNNWKEFGYSGVVVR